MAEPGLTEEVQKLAKKNHSFTGDLSQFSVKNKEK